MNETSMTDPQLQPARSSAKKLIIAAALILPVLTILLLLGVWQTQRHAWKTALIADIKAGANAPTMDFATAVSRWQRGDNIEYYPIAFRGEALHDNAMRLYRPNQVGLEWALMTPVRAATGTTVLVQHYPEASGLVQQYPEARPSDKPVAAAGHAGKMLPATTQQNSRPEVRIHGFIRSPPTQPSFAPANNPAQNEWYWRDITAMYAQIGAQPAAPFFIEIPISRPGQTTGVYGEIPLPHNRHFGYALTWFGLAVALVGVAAAYVWSTRRR